MFGILNDTNGSCTEYPLCICQVSHFPIYPHSYYSWFCHYWLILKWVHLASLLLVISYSLMAWMCAIF